jgi:hypothetical protein
LIATREGHANALVKNVYLHDPAFAPGRDDAFAQAGQAGAQLGILLLLIDQATLEPPTLARHLARIQNQPLVFGIANRDRGELR